MQIAHFTTELQGGAGVAAMRLHQALLDHGEESQLFYRKGITEAPHCQRDQRLTSALGRFRTRIAMSREHRQWANGGFVTAPQWIDQTPLQDFCAPPDVVNLHWVSRWLDLPSFFSSLPMASNGFPIVWSLHDMNPLTGGCHHSGSCDHFIHHCGDCPQLKHPGRKDLSARYFAMKERAYEGLNLHIVGNSQWMTAQARRSGLMRHAKSFQTIPLGLDLAQFRPLDKYAARVALQIPNDQFVVGFACTDFSDPNKGGEMLLETLSKLSQQTPLTLLIFCGGKLPESSGNFSIIEVGALPTPELQSHFYSACDLLVVPSRIESFGLTALEAMACGTPVVAYRTGGLPDIVEHQETGLLVDELRSQKALLGALRWMIDHPAERETMRMASRQRAVNEFSDQLMASRYSNLYENLISP